MNDQRRKALLEEIEKIRHSKVIVYFSYTPLDDGILVPLYQELNKIGRTPKIDLFLHSYGGAVDTPYKVVMLIREFCEEFSVIVPFSAKSAASMIVLGADEVVMGPISELGPIDPLVKHPLYKDFWIPVQALRCCFEYIEELIENNSNTEVSEIIVNSVLNKLDPWLIGDYEKALKASRQYAESLLSKYMLKNNKEKVKVVTQNLTNGYFSHGYPIGRAEAKEMGICVTEASGELWGLIWELYLVYQSMFSGENTCNFSLSTIG
ncbi:MULTISPECIES: peptidase [unclassified Dehalobacter]|uniref:SDH family Clp fold serine proteinase n=1 Tax=unclassified Dehalobacter TaxID=2635733 RepID=UPI000E6C4B9B|nr:MULTISPECIES: peptidase [unclassified Dehalobacter]RJE46916.1 peptidase [Dehalobacter sp. MCB1]TCX50840.1 peptidase [Dehalobacter sp. 12DCB1]TCX51551.1 peptidase [Dehalobacter sp. 14DCB1]